MTHGNKKLGYISIYRSIKDHWIWDDPVKFQWWISLLLEVNFKERKVNLGNDLVLCKRGQTVKSLKHFAELWNTTRDSARNFLVLLEKDGMILRNNLHKSTQITICNYDSYQDNLHANQTQPQQQTKRKPNANQTHSDTNNNVNTVNNLNKDNKEDKQEVVFPFESEYFLQNWELWKDFKQKEFKFKYKTPQSEQAALNKLNNLADGLEETAIQIIHESLSNGWKGFFKLKENNNGKSREVQQSYADKIQSKYPEYEGKL